MVRIRLERQPVYKFKSFAQMLTIAALVVVGHGDTASAQTLAFNLSPVGMSISGPGATGGPTSVSVSSSTGISSLFISNITTSGGSGNWLCPVVSGTSINVYIGTNNCSFSASTTQLAANQNYTGTVTVSGN